MKTEFLNALSKEHHKILVELDNLERLLNVNFDLSDKASTLYELVKEHHKREDSSLYEWMLNQNETVDRDIVVRMRNDHEDIEILLENMKKEKNEKILSFDLKDFIDLYREHVNLEEQFIFQIAKGIIAEKKLFP